MQFLFPLKLLIIGPLALEVFAHNRRHWTVLHSKSDQTVCDPDIPSRPSPVGPAISDHEDGEARIVCREGEYLDWYKCSPCDEGTFLTRQMVKSNRLSRCHKCQEPGLYEISTEPCTRTRDSRVMCEDGFYRYEVPGKPCLSACFRCDICGVGKNMFKEFEGSACGGYNNTVCCPGDDMIVVKGRCVPTERTTKTTTRINSGPETEPTNWSLSFQDLEHQREHFGDFQRVDYVLKDTQEFERNFGHGLKMDFNLAFAIYINFLVTVFFSIYKL